MHTVHAAYQRARGKRLNNLRGAKDVIIDDFTDHA